MYKYLTYKLKDKKNLGIKIDNHPINKVIQNVNNKNQFYILAGNQLSLIQVDINGNSQKLWEKTFDEIKSNVQDIKTDHFYVQDDFIVINTLDSLVIYKINADNTITQLKDLRTFPPKKLTLQFLKNFQLNKYEINESILFGSFIDAAGLIGMVTFNTKKTGAFAKFNGVKLWLIDEKIIEKPGTNLPIFEIRDGNYDELAKIQQADISIQKVNLDDQIPQVVVRHTQGITTFIIHKQGDDESVLKVHHFPDIIGPQNDAGQNEITLFGNFFKKSPAIKDLDCVIRNSDGLHVYESIGNGRHVLRTINHMFSDEKGWDSVNILKTLKLHDATGDGLDELIFTGPDGIQILSYNFYEDAWYCLMDQKKIQASDRGTHVLAALNQEKEMNLLIENLNGVIESWNFDIIELQRKDIPKIEPVKHVTIEKPKFQIPNSSIEIPAAKMLPLKDILNYESFMKNTVELVSGKPKFTIPLMDMISRHLNFFTLNYDGSSDINGPLGLGWSIPESQIILVDQGCLFPETHRYILIHRHNTMEIFLVESILQEQPPTEIENQNNKNENENEKKANENDNEDEDEDEDEEEEELEEEHFYHYFSLVRGDKTNANIMYDTKKQIWTVKTEGQILIYGSDTATGYDLTWEYWRGRGNAYDQRIRIPKFWNLAEIRNEANEIVTIFKYHAEEVYPDEEDAENEEEDATFSREMHLTYVEASMDDGTKVKLMIEYEAKDEDELDHQYVGDGNYEKQTMITKYMSGYKVSTSEFNQEIEFEYKVINKIRLLTNIKQKMPNGQDENVLVFNYDESDGFLREIISPYNLKTEMEPMVYEDDSHNYFPPAPIHFETIELDSNIYHGKDYILLTYLKKDGPRTMVAVLLSSDLKQRLVHDHQNGLTEIIEYNVFASDNMFTICSTSRKNKKKQALIFSKNYFEDDKIERSLDEKWNIMSPKVYDLSERAICTGGRDFVVFADVHLKEEDECYKRIDPTIPPEQLNRRHTLIRVEYVEGKLEEKTLVDSDRLEITPKADHPLHNNTVSHEILANCESSRCLFYVPPVLTQMWKNSTDDWNFRRVVLIRSHHNKNIDTFDKFDIECERKKFMLHTLKRTSLQQKCNVIMAYKLSITDHVLFAHTRLIMLGPEHNYVKILERNQVKDHLIDKEFGVRRGAIIYRYEWNSETGQYKVYAKMADKEETEQLNEQEGALVTEQTAEMQKQQAFLLNIREYVSRLTDRGELIQNDTTLVYDGNSWKEKSAPKEIKQDERFEQKFSDKYNVTQANSRSEVHLKRISDGKLIRLEGLYDIGMIIVGPQSYLVYKNKQNVLKIRRFDTNGNIYEQDYSINFEQVSPDTNSKLLITYGNYTRDKPTINFRIIEPKIITKVVEKHTLTCEREGTTRLTGFTYEKPHVYGSNVLFEQVTLKPSYLVDKFGYIRYENNLKEPKKSYSMTFNSDGQIIKQDDPEKKQVSDEEKEWEKKAKEMTMFDKERQVHLFTHAPYRISNDEVYANGFEKYEFENKQIESYDAKLIKNLAAPCGKRVLRLKDGNKYMFKVTPVAQHLEYEFVLLGRVLPYSNNNNISIGSMFPSIKANIYDGSNYRSTVVSTVKIIRDGWLIFEIVLNMPFLKAMNEKYSSNSSSSSSSSTTPLRIEVTVTPDTNKIIDIDHIVFIPKDLRSTINVYDYALWKVTCELTTSGMFIKRIYDKNNNEIATCDEYNQITQFDAYSKLSTQLLKGNNLRTEITVAGNYGIYDNFDIHSLENRWKIDSPDAWGLKNSKLYHTNTGTNKIQLQAKFNIKSICIRFDYILYKDESDIQINENILLRGRDLTLLYNGQSINAAKIPYKGEIILIIENDRLFLLIDGIVYLDNKNADGVDQISFTITELVSIERMIILDDPQISISYLNSIGEEQQRVHLISSNQAIVRAWSHDMIGRKVMETFPIKIETRVDENLLSYNKRIIPGSNYKHKKISYFKDPLSNIEYIDIPGTKFTASNGKTRKFILNPMRDQLKVFEEWYPIIRGFTYETELKAGDVRELCIYNQQRQKVLTYVYMPGRIGILSTYKHDNRKNLLKTLTPNFHDENNTLQKQQRENPNLEQLYAYFFKYDKYDNPIETTGPDAGKRKNIYDKGNFLKFIITFCYEPSLRSEVCSVIFMNYDTVGRLISSGYLEEPRSVDVGILSSLADEEISEQTQILRNHRPKIYQKLQYNDGDNDGYREENVKRVMSYYPHKFVEEYVTNIYKKLVTKRLYLPLKDNKVRVVEINEKNSNSKVRQSIEYPYEHNGNALTIKFDYNKLNQIVAIRMPNNQVIAKYEYNPEGYVIKETLYPTINELTNVREYIINEIGSYAKIADNYLEEIIEYTTPGYGNQGFGDGSVTVTKFTAKWHDKAHDVSLQLNKRSFSDAVGVKLSETCYEDLKKAGYIDQNGHQTRIFYNEYNENISPCCYEYREKIAKIMGTNGFPYIYGHLYDYGNNQQLTKAKYFVGSTNGVKPLQPQTFQKVVGPQQIDNIWYNLAINAKTKIITVDYPNPNVPFSAQGKSFKSLINENLLDEIKHITINGEKPFDECYRSLEPMLLYYYVNRNGFNKSHLEKFFSQEAINELWQKISNVENVINPVLRQAFTDDNLRLKIVSILKEHFAKQIGQAEFDVESYEIDANGNHKIFGGASSFYHIEYEKPKENLRTNIDRIQTIRKNNVDVYPIKHDSLGNVIEAKHKNILYMKYDPVINKLSEAGLTNGKVVKYGYDVKGDRIFKKIYSNNKLSKETFYIRDGTGKCLVQRDVKYFSNSKSMVTMTAYLYGPNGLLGFLRNGNLYTVFTDHEGSVRLVEKNGEIVASYDYYPYGCLMRSYGSDPDAHISFRYAGHEWDDETGLYYMVARYYDCEIGRFYQMDPMAQYFSPYLYAGNSPISMIDPDGEFAFLLIILVCAIVGAYLGGAAANGSWNPADWDWTSADTWLGMIGGAVAGALLPFGAVQSVGVLVSVGVPAWAAWATVTTIGVGFALFEGSKVQGTWNVFEWDFSDPKLINAMFVGFSSGAGLIGDVASFKQALTFYKGLNTFKKCLFIGATVGTGFIHVYIEGSAHEWNIKDPDFWKSMIMAAFSAPQGGMTFVKGWDKAAKRFSSFKSFVKNAKTGSITFRDIMTRDTGKKLIKYAVEVMSVTESAASLGLDVTLAVMTDQVLWNAIGSKAYSVCIKDMLDDQNAKDRRWQAAMTYVPTKLILQITSLKQLPPKIDKNDINYLHELKQRPGESLASKLKQLENDKNKHLTYSVASKQITTLDNLKDSELCVIHNHEGHTHVVTILNKQQKQIFNIDDFKFNKEIMEAIENKKNDILHECKIKFANIKNQIKETILKEIDFLGNERNEHAASVDIIIENALNTITQRKPFINAFYNDIRLLLKSYRIKLNNQIITILNSKQNFETLIRLLTQKKEMGPSIDSQIARIMTDFESTLMDIEEMSYNWSPEIGPKNVSITNVDTMLPTYYEISDLIYTIGKQSIYSKIIEECEVCPDTVANHMHQSEKDLGWLAELGTINTDDGLLLEPAIYEQSTSRRLQKRELNYVNNSTIVDETVKKSDSKSKITNWLMSKWNSCLKYLNLYTSESESWLPNEINNTLITDHHHTTNQPNNYDLFNNRPQIDQQELPPTNLEFTPDYSIADVNSTLFLIDMCVRKITGEKFIGHDGQISVTRAQLLTMNIIEDIENMLNEILINNTLRIEDINFPELQCKIFQAIFSGTMSKIPDIVVDYLIVALEDVTIDEKDNIEAYFNRKCQ